MRVSALVIVVAVAIGAAGFLSASGAHAQLQRFTIGSNPSGTNTFVIAGGLARLLQDETGIPVTVRPFSGASVTHSMLHRGELALGVNGQLTTYFAYAGLTPYPAAMNNIRLLIALMPIRINFLVRAESGLRTIADLRGRKVVTNIRSNASLERELHAILGTAGLTPSDVEEVAAAALPSSIGMLTQGRVDAAWIALDSALSRRANSGISGGVRFLSLGNDDSVLLDVIPGTRIEVVRPESGFVGILDPTRLARLDVYLNTGSHISESDAYLIVKTIVENWATLQSDYALLSDVSLEMLAPSAVPVPYHPGAVRYLKEAGLWTDAHEIRQRSLLAEDGR
jgi:TRAP transporter TAXI family solute receptor